VKYNKKFSMLEGFSLAEARRRIIEIGENAIFALEQILIVPDGVEKVRVLIYRSHPHQVAILSYSLLHISDIFVEEADD